MFCPHEILINSRRLFVQVHTGIDYVRGAPWLVRYNPLRWEIILGERRDFQPHKIVINRDGRAYLAWAKFWWDAGYKHIWAFRNRRRFKP